MAKRLKFLAIALVALLAVSIGYLETHENWTGVKDNAFIAYAAVTNLDCNTVAADDPDYNMTAGDLLAQNASFSGPVAATGYGAPGALVAGLGSTRAALKLALNALFTAKLPANFNALWNVRAITATVAGGAAGDIVALPQDPRAFDGFGGNQPADYKLYKHNATTTTWTSLPYVANPAFTAPTADGWALFQVTGFGADAALGGGDDAVAYVAAGQDLSATANYYLVLYIEDNGDYDTAAAAGTITDPPAFGFVPPAAAAAADDDDDDDFLGCVANPAATLSLEWLLLCIAPALYWIRRRR